MRYMTDREGPVPEEDRGRTGPTAVGPAQARDSVADLLAGVDPPVDDLTRGDVLLVASELVTNAIRHGGGVAAFAVTVAGDTVELRVSDHSMAVPTSTARQGFPVGGYGWTVVYRLARSTDITFTATGKTVRAVLPLRGGTGPRRAPRAARLPGRDAPCAVPDPDVP